MKRKKIDQKTRQYIASKQLYLCNFANRKHFDDLFRNKIMSYAYLLVKYKANEHCSVTLPRSFDIDHIVGLQFEGPNDISNLEALCPACHQMKTWLESQIAAAIRHEKKTRCSKYFNPLSVFYNL